MAAAVDSWSSQTIGDISTLKPFFEAAQKGLELHKENAAFIKTIYEVNKALMLATIDPLFAAIDKILDEILKLLDDLRGLGFYYIPVHSKSVSTNVERNPITGGLFAGGKYYAKATRKGNGNLVPMNAFIVDIPAKNPDGLQLYVEATEMNPGGHSPEDAAKFKDPGGFDATIHKAYVFVNNDLGLTTITPMGILQTIDKSFDDKNDVPKANTEISEASSQSLDNVATQYLEELAPEKYFLSGRPIFSPSAHVGGIIIIAGAPDFDKFSNIMEAINKLIDIDSFTKLISDVKKIWASKETSKIKISWVAAKNITKGAGSLDGPVNTESPGQAMYIEGDDSMGSFNQTKFKRAPDSGAIIPTSCDKVVMTYGENPVAAAVTKVLSSENMVIEDVSTLGHKDATHNEDLTEGKITRRHTPVKTNRNLVPYQNQELEVEYLTKGAKFQKGMIIAQGVASVGTENMTKDGKIDKETAEAGDAEKSGGSGIFSQIKEGDVVCGKIVEEYIADAVPEKPDWRGKRLEELIPQMGSILDTTETHVRGIKATVKSARKTLDPIIEWLDGKMDELQAFAAEIEGILELFAVGIPAAGVYTLYLPPKLGGTAEFRNRMLTAGGPNKPPEILKFCAGVCFLGGGPTGGPLVKSVETLALLLGLREQTAAEVKQTENMTKLATPVFDEEKTYMAGDEIYYKGTNYKCLVNYTSGEPPIVKGFESGEDEVNSAYWESLGAATGEDEQVLIGDPRTPEEIRKAKIEFLKETKKQLGDILIKLNGTSGSAVSLRKKINDVPLYGYRDPLQDDAFISSGANEATFQDLQDLRDQDLNELNLLVQRINEILVKVEITMIQETPDPETEAGSLRSKGKSLLILKGEFIEEVDDFEGGQRKVKPNTTITIMDPLNPGSGSTRTVEYMSNTTVAVLDEPFAPDIETALPYDVILSDQNETDYKYLQEYRANNTHYYHPGYRLREFKAKANTISTFMTTEGGKYTTLPNHEAGSRFGQAAENTPRTTDQYPLGTIIEINGTVPESEGFIGGGGVAVLLEEEEQVADSWNAIGVSQDDLLIVVLDAGTFTKYIIEVIDDTHIAIDSIIQSGGGDSPSVDLLYHPDWDFELSIGKKQVKAQEDKIQDSKNKFADYLREINEKADEVYSYLDKLNNEGW